MIKVKNIIKSYGDRKVLDMPNFTFNAGRSYAIMGANGSGKSTLLKIITGVTIPDQGEVIIKVGNKISYSPQKSYAFAYSVKKNLMLACPDKNAYKMRINYLLSQLDLTKLKNKKATKLSGGETQKMALARTLLANAPIIILDEPTASMDINAIKVSEKLIKEYQSSSNATLIFATHSIKQAERLADYVLFFDKGELYEHGTPDTLFYKPNRPSTIEFLQNFAF